MRYEISTCFSMLTHLISLTNLMCSGCVMFDHFILLIEERISLTLEEDLRFSPLACWQHSRSLRYDIRYVSYFDQQSYLYKTDYPESKEYYVSGSTDLNLDQKADFETQHMLLFGSCRSESPYTRVRVPDPDMRNLHAYSRAPRQSIVFLSERMS
jgi:hypothetical protein